MVYVVVEYEVDGDVDSEIVGDILDVEDRSDDETALVVSSDDAASQRGWDVKADQAFCVGQALDEPQSRSGLAPTDEPYVGQEFNSEAAAHAFYNAYATRVGFVLRVSKLSRSRRDGTAIGRSLVCNKEGFRMPDKREKILRQRAETRVGCRAMILVRKVSSGKWVVTKCEKEHTHQLSPGKGRKDLIYDQYPNEHDKIRELSQQLAAEKKRSTMYKRHLEMIFEHIEDYNQSLSKKIEGIVNNVRQIEAEEHKTNN